MMSAKIYIFTRYTLHHVFYTEFDWLATFLFLVFVSLVTTMCARLLVNGLQRRRAAVEAQKNVGRGCCFFLSLFFEHCLLTFFHLLHFLDF